MLISAEAEAESLLGLAELGQNRFPFNIRFNLKPLLSEQYFNLHNLLNTDFYVHAENTETHI